MLQASNPDNASQSNSSATQQAKHFYELEEYAELWNVCIATIYNYLRRGELIGHKVGGRTIITATEHNRFAENLPRYTPGPKRRASAA